MRRVAFLVLFLLSASAEDCGERLCQTSADCPAAARCHTLGEVGVCVPDGVAVGVVLNRLRAVCAARGHDFTGKTSRKLKCFRYTPRGGVEKVVRSRTCSRCGGDVPVNDDGECDEKPPGCE